MLTLPWLLTSVGNVRSEFAEEPCHLTEWECSRRSEPPGTRIIVFCGTKRMCDQLAMNLSREYRAAAIHGDKKQQERDAVLAAFKVGSRIESLG